MITLRPKADRRELPACPSCEGPAARLPDTSNSSRLRWFRCTWCRHIWCKGPKFPAIKSSSG